MSRPSTEWRSASRENYKKFCEEHPDAELSYKEFCTVIYTWNDFLMTHVLETGEKIKLPYGFGYISINKKKTLRYYQKGEKQHCILPVDWVKSKEYGKKIYILNHHTEGFRFKWYWFKGEARLKFADIWRFKPARKYSRLLATYLTQKKDKNYTDVYNEWYSGRRNFNGK